jgi:hypothetical protein
LGYFSQIDMTESVSEILAASVRKLLRPLVRVLLRHGIPHQTFADFSKQAYVDVAAEEFTLAGRKPSISRVSLLTGLTRKEVSRRLREREAPSAPAERYNRAARVIGTWVREAEYHAANGQPATLEIDGEGGFAELVRESGVDVPVRAVLDELLRVEAVERTRTGRLRLRHRAYIPETGDADKIEILGTDVADLISSIDHNMTSPREDAFFQRKVAYDALVDDCLPELRLRVRRRGQALLEHLDRFMAEHDRDASPDVEGEGEGRAVLGIYYHEETTGDPR